MTAITLRTAARLRLVFSVLLVLALAVPSLAARRSSSGGDVYVRGYTRRDGTYVQPHYRSAPDGDFYNNWSTKGNVNPYTGVPGTKVTPPAGFGGSSYGGRNAVTGSCAEMAQELIRKNQWDFDHDPQCRLLLTNYLRLMEQLDERKRQHELKRQVTPGSASPTVAGPLLAERRLKWLLPWSSIGHLQTS